MPRKKIHRIVKKEQEVSQILPPTLTLPWQGALRILQDRIFKVRSPRGHGSGFHIGNFGDGGGLCAIATAYHVISSEHDWGEPIKITQAQTGKELLIKENDRAIFTYPDKDLAVILFKRPHDFELPTDQIDLIPGSNLLPGVEVAWCGFPAIMADKPCFFHGYISCYLDNQGDYLVDGVAINGVSGGPVFYIENNTNKPKVAGVITAYVANRATGETLPGLSVITSISPCEDTIKSLKTLNDAKKEVEEQKITDSKSKSSDIV